MITGNLTNRELISPSLKRDLARIVGFALAGYLYLKLWDWAATSYCSHTPGKADVLSRLQAITPYTQTFWWIEVVLAGIIPLVILLYRPLLNNDRLLMIALALVVAGVVVNRWNVTLSGLVAPPQWSPGVLGHVIAATYSPTWMEVAVSTGVLAYALLAFTLGVRYLRLYSKGNPAT